MTQSKKQMRYRDGQRGFVLVIVFVIIMLVSALGLMAMRHVRQEVRSASAYVDSTQAISLAESAMAISMADLRTAPDYYEFEFADPSNEIGTGWNLKYAIPLSTDGFLDEEADAAPSVCSAGEAGEADGCVNLLSSPFFNKAGTSDAHHTNATFLTTITYDVPVVGPCPPGYSCFDDQNYAWYVFGMTATARYGSEDVSFWSNKFIEQGRAVGSARVTIGPIGAYGR